MVSAMDLMDYQPRVDAEIDGITAGIEERNEQIEALQRQNAADEEKITKLRSVKDVIDTAISRMQEVGLDALLKPVSAPSRSRRGNGGQVRSHKPRGPKGIVSNMVPEIVINASASGGITTDEIVRHAKAVKGVDLKRSSVEAMCYKRKRAGEFVREGEGKTALWLAIEKRGGGPPASEEESVPASVIANGPAAIPSDHRERFRF